MSDPTTVLDASAVAALLFDEPGGVRVADAIADGAALSSVNLSEVVTLLLRRQQDPASLVARLISQVEVYSFDVPDAMAAAALSLLTRPAGLSLGDRACLALAQRLAVPALTADTVWTALKLPVTIEGIRGT